MAQRAAPTPSKRVSAVLIALGALGGVILIALPAHDEEPKTARSILARAAPGEAVRAILAQGEAAYLELLLAAARGSWSDGVALTPEARAIVDEALQRVDGRRFVEFLARAAPRLPPDLRATAMRLIAARGEARDVAALLSIADKTGSTDELAPALSALIARDASALDEMQGRLFRLEDPVLREVVRAVGNSSRSRAVGLLADLVGRSIDLDGAILGELGRLGAVAEPETARKAARRVRSLLDERNPGLARAAVNALARLGDPDPVGDLIELLASEDTGLARTAYAGLKQLTGLRLRESPGPWAAWHAEQVAWADAALDRTLDALLDAELAVVLEALRELQQHPLERHLIAEEVAGLLRRPEPELRRAAADALRCLGSRAPVEELVPLLDDEDPSTAAAARRALVALLGSEPGASPPTEADPETLPRSEPEQAAWLAVISGRR